MFKRLIPALAGLLALAGIANAAGTVPGFSLTPQFDLTGKVAPGCKLFVIQAGTVSTPQNAYQDSGLSILAPNPLLCDPTGRIAQFFLADGLIKLRLTTSTGTQIFVGDNLLVVGPSGGGGGGGGTVDPTTILATGDIKANYGTGILSGFVRANGRTVGSSTSGATERANADCQALFQYLWGVDANLAVSGGRGASAAADWAANKTIALPDMRGRSLAGLDDMGNTAAGRLTGPFWGTSGTCTVALGTTLGQGCGAEKIALALIHLPTGITSSNASQAISVTTPDAILHGGTAGGSLGSGGSQPGPNSSTGQTYSADTASGSNSISVTSNNTGGSAHNIMPPTILITYYQKL